VRNGTLSRQEGSSDNHRRELRVERDALSAVLQNLLSRLVRTPPVMPGRAECNGECWPVFGGPSADFNRFTFLKGRHKVIWHIRVTREIYTRGCHFKRSSDNQDCPKKREHRNHAIAAVLVVVAYGAGIVIHGKWPWTIYSSANKSKAPILGRGSRVLLNCESQVWQHPHNAGRTLILRKVEVYAVLWPVWLPSWFDVDIAIAVLLAIFTIGLTVIALEATYKPPTMGQVRLYRGLTLFFAAATVAFIIAQASRGKHSEAERDLTINGLEHTVSELRNIILNSPESAEHHEMLSLLGEFMKKRSPVSKLRVAPPSGPQAGLASPSTSQSAPNPAHPSLPPPTNLPAQTGAYDLWTGQQLRDYAINFANSMRQFELAFERNESAIDDDLRSRRIRGDSALPPWDQQTNAMLQRYSDHKAKFDAIFYGEGRALMAEMLKRLNESPPGISSDPMAFTLDSLSGAHPIKIAADYLEGLARRLH